MVPPLALQDPAGRGSRGQHEDKPTDTPRGRLPTATFPVQAAERGPGKSSSAASGETQGRGKDGAASSAGEQAGVGAAPKSDPPPAPGDVDMEKSVTPRASPRRGCSWSLQSTEELPFCCITRSHSVHSAPPPLPGATRLCPHPPSHAPHNPTPRLSKAKPAPFFQPQHRSPPEGGIFPPPFLFLHTHTLASPSLAV